LSPSHTFTNIAIYYVCNNKGNTSIGQQSLEEQERYHRKQQKQSLSPSIPPSQAAIQPLNISPYPTDQIFQSESTHITTDDEQTTTLTQETTLKIQELKKLVYRYPQYHRYPAAVISCVIHFCNNGDNTLLEEKLEELRTFHRAMGFTRM